MQEERLEHPEDGNAWRIDLRIKAGDCVLPGEIIAVVESDKATAEVDAPQAMRVVSMTRTSRGYVISYESPENS